MFYNMKLARGHFSKVYHFGTFYRETKGQCIFECNVTIAVKHDSTSDIDPSTTAQNVVTSKRNGNNRHKTTLLAHRSAMQLCLLLSGQRHKVY